MRDLSPLRGNLDLRVLRVRGTNVRSLDPVKGLESLQLLDAAHTRITDVSPLARLREWFGRSEEK